jgi:uncharacterized iron-regulated membrane protein
MMRLFHRRLWVRVHRWAGSYLAGFLIIAGLTGSLLAFLGPLGDWLNSGLRVLGRFAVRVEMDPITLFERAQALAGPARVESVPLRQEPGQAQQFWFEPDPRAPVTQGASTEAFGIVMDPCSGEEPARRSSSTWSLSRRNFMGYVYSLHYSLAADGRRLG